MATRRTAQQDIYGRTSPYFRTNIVDRLYLDVLDARPIPQLETDAEMTITAVYEARPDLLAYDLYQDSKLWWVFAARNPDILGPDPYFNMKDGTKIRVPRIETLRQTLGI